MAHVALTAEQAMLAATVARVVADHPADADPGGRRVWGALVELGVLGLRVPAALGGVVESLPAGELTPGELTPGAVETALVVEELARGGSGAPYLGSVLAVELLVAAASPAASAVVAEVLAGRPAAPVLDPDLGRLAAAGVAID
nr:acyl-CoA dehydrogenase family protein [Micromonospora sp. DSM 115978]